MSTEQGSTGRFEWERAVRRAPTLPWHVKSFLLLLGTYMDKDGTNCRPSSAELESVMVRSRQRIFELLAIVEAEGWMRFEPRPGKPTLRVPLIPAAAAVVEDNPSDTSDYSEQGTSDGSYGSEAPEVVHTRQTGLTHPSDPSDAPVRPVLHDQVRTKSGPQENGAAPAPDPRRTGRAALARTDDRPAADVLPDTPTGPDQETHVPRRGRNGRAKCEPHGLAAGRGGDGLPRCQLCRREAGPLAPVIQLPLRRVGGGAV